MHACCDLLSPNEGMDVTEVRQPTRILVLGGGFAGLYAVRALERAFRRRPDVEITVVNRDNFFLFTPMLHEVAASDLDLTHIVNPVRKMLERAAFFQGEVQHIDLERKEVVVTHGAETPHPHALAYDHLVMAMGSETNFFATPGVAERAFTMRTLGDAISLRNRLLESLEEADSECCSATRQPLLTFTVAGGGFAGVETVGAINDFVRESVRFFPNLRKAEVRMVLVHSGEELLPELSPKLGRYARKMLERRGVEVRIRTKVAAHDGNGVRLSDGTTINGRTLVWTAGTSPHRLLTGLPCKKERGRVLVDSALQVAGWPGVWALGDCAAVPDQRTGGFHPPTAQHACRQGPLVARNIAAAMAGEKVAPFRFRTLGQLAAIGRRAGVASMFGVSFSGFFAWWMWRTIYLSKLPRFERKLRVALDWTLDLMFSKDLVQCPAVDRRLRPSVATDPPFRPVAAVVPVVDAVS